MRLKFSTKLVLVNILVAAVVAALIGFIVIQGLMLILINNTVTNLTTVANESTVLIRQSIYSLATTDPAETVYIQNADFYATQIASVYSSNIVLFDNSMHAVGSNMNLEDFSMYTDYVSQVSESREQSYVYTQTDGVNSILFLSPVFITSKSQPVGVMLIIYPTSNMDLIIRYTTYLFIGGGFVSAAVAAVLYTLSYRRMTSPIRQLVEFTEEAVEDGDEKLDVPDIDYSVNDDIGALVNSFKDMAVRVNEKIDDLEISRNQMATVFSSMQDGVIAFDSQKNVITQNRRLSEMFPDLKIALAGFDAVFEQLLTEKPESASEFEYEGKNYLLNAKRIEMREGGTGVLFVVSDITAVKKVEEEQNRFISSVSHELKTPLTTLIGYTDLLERRGFDDKALAEKAISTMKNEGNRLLRLVNDLLNINKYHSYDFDLIFTDIDPDALLVDVCSEMNVASGELGISVMYDSRPLPQIKGDYDRLKQSLINVIENAIKYSKPGDAVRVNAIPDDEFLEITIRDYGEGIPEDKKEKIFETFYRVEEDRSRLSIKGGFGLGLSIVKNIIERHNGTVSVESFEGEGTLMVIRLPLPKDNSKAERVPEDISGEVEGDE